MKIFFDALSRMPTVSIGTQAYIISGMQILNKEFPNCVFYILSSNPDIEKSYLDETCFNINIIKRSESQWRTVLQVREIVRNVDAVVSSWGDAYITDPPYKLFKKVLFLKKKGIPLVLFTSSIGPFVRGIKRYIAKRGLKLFDCITVRDSITFQYVKELGLSNVKMIHDTAFVLGLSPDDKILRILNDVGIPSDKTFIGLNISILLYHRFHDINRTYVDEVVELVYWLREKYQKPIMLIPHQIYPDCCNYTKEQYQSSGGDDRYVIELIMNKLKDRTLVYALMGQYSPMDLKGIINHCEIFIGGRMHSVIAAISQCIPSLIMQYSHKASGMMKALNMSEFVWDISDSHEILKRKISSLWNNKESVRSKLNEMMPGILSEIYGIVGEIKTCLKP